MTDEQMQSLAIEDSVYDAMLAAAHRVAPLEACGLLGGVPGQATAFHELTNADASGEHYSMIPEEQFAAVKDMREKGMGLVGIWHSHPASPARMSEEDLRLAYTPNAVYVIVSLVQPGNPVVRAFVMTDGAPVPIRVEVTARERVRPGME